MKPPQDFTSRLVAHMDAESTLSITEIIEKFRARQKLFFTCVIAAPVLAIALTCLVPQSYKAQAQLMISREGYTTYFKDVTTERENITAQSAAELLRSVPVCVRMIDAVGVTDKDVARPAFKTLLGTVLGTIQPLLGKDAEDTVNKQGNIKTIRLAESLKDSIETSTLQIDRAIINPRDEVIEVKMKSTNREKVAAMANQLCRSFIEEYDSRAAAEAARAHELLVAQAERVQSEFVNLRDAVREEVGGTASASRDPADSTVGGTVHPKPLTEGMGNKISDLEMKVIELQRIYTENAPEVVRARAELEQARSTLNRQEALDSTTALLAILKKKQRQAKVAEALYRNGQSGIVILEEAIAPPPSKMAVLLHFAFPAIGGVVGGVVLGSALLLLLSTVDVCVRTKSDVKRLGGDHPVLETVRVPGGLGHADLKTLPVAKNIAPLLRASGAMELINTTGDHLTVLVASADHFGDDGETALQLASLLARDSKLRVLLIDGDLERATLTAALQLGSVPGLVESLATQKLFVEVAQPTSWKNLHFIPAGNLAARASLGFFSAIWKQRLEEARISYDVVIVYAPGIVDRAETPVLAREMDQALVVTLGGATLRQSLERAVLILDDFGVHILGTVLTPKAAEGHVAQG